MNRILLRLLTKPSTRYRPLLPISFHFPSARRLALMAPKRKAAAPRAPSPSSSHSEAESHDQDSPVKPAAPPPAKKPKAAPKKAAKKDADVEEEDDQEEMKEAKKPAAAKKAPIPRKKKGDVPAFPQPEGEPEYPEIVYKNKELPSEYTLPDKVGDVKIAAWNVTSLKSACDPKNGSGLMGYIEKEDADILILTETKRNDMAPIPQDKALKERYPYQKWANSNQKGYAGTVVLSKVKPISTEVNLTVETASGGQDIIFGRLALMEFESLYLIGTYSPNASEKLKNMDGKVAWNKAFEAKLRELEAKKPVVWGGDINVVASGNDISDAQKNWNKCPGWTQTELEGFQSQLAIGLYDAWRDLKGPNRVEYSFHSKRVLQREKGKGWRLDTFVVSEKLRERVIACEIRREIFGPSDHVPVVLELKGGL